MIERLFNKCIVAPSDLAPSREDMEVVGVFNPGAVDVGVEVVLLLRVAERPRNSPSGLTLLPRHDPSDGLVTDAVANGELVPIDPRVVVRSADGLVRLTFISHLRIARTRDGRTIDSIDPVRFGPENDYEEFGVEDPRVTRIGDTFYFTYVAVSRHGAATALASTRDFRTFKRHGIIFCPENKDVVLFPERIGGRYLALHRPNPATPFCRPEMWIAASTDLVHWGAHEHFFEGGSGWDSGRIGAGAPPIRADRGWLEIYHGNRKAPHETGVGTYSAGVLLLDANDPRRIIASSSRPIMEPQVDFELSGFVPGVVFPTGMVLRDDRLLVYYGAADTCAALVEFRLQDVLAALR